MEAQVPRTLPFEGRVIVHAGAGRAPGAKAYFDAITSRTLELYFGQVTATGPIFSMVVLAGNQAVRQVRVDNAVVNGARAPRRGDVLIVGPLEHLPAGPKAKAAWPARMVGNGPQPPVNYRQTGVIVHLASTGPYGRIVDDGGRSYFFRLVQVARGVSAVVGARVSFVASQHDPRGPEAFDVRAA